MIYLVLLLLGGEKIPELQRTTFDLQLIDGRQIIQARLALNYLDENQFSLHLSKAPTGTLFTYWATPEKNILAFPKEKVTFVGAPEEGFALFADGPKMMRSQWLKLLETGEHHGLGPWLLHEVDGWFSLHDDPITFRIRWRAKKTETKTDVKRRVLQPDMDKLINVQPLQSLLGFAWSE